MVIPQEVNQEPDEKMKEKLVVEKGEGEEVTENCNKEEHQEPEEEEGAQDGKDEEGTETRNKEVLQRGYSQNDTR